MRPIERWVLAIMWPLAVGLLSMAVLETLGAWLGPVTPSRTHVVDSVTVNGTQAVTSSASTPGALSILEECGREIVGRTSAYPVPQVVAVVTAVLTAVLRSGALSGSSAMAKDIEKLPSLLADEAPSAERY
jgi:hypothetical protein